MSAVDWDWQPSGQSGRTAGSLLLLVLAIAAPAPSRAATTTVQTVDESGQPLTDGSVVLCPLAADCLEFPIATDGTIALDRTRLEPGTAYTIIVYSAQRSVRYAAFEWVYDPAAFAAAAGDKPVVPRLRGNERQEIAFEFAPDGGPVAAASPTTVSVATTPPAGDRTLATPRFVAGVYVPFMFGEHFGVDHEALGGVDDLAPGFGAFVAYRFGYPESAASGHTAVGFREASISYAFNRYTVGEIDEPTATSDLTFHRITLAFGVGRSTARALVSGALAFGYGGIYDGNELLEYGGRTYGMVGVGFQGRCGYRLLGGATHGLGLFGQLELMYYPADSGDDDHWYGLAPSLAAGFLVH